MNSKLGILLVNMGGPTDLAGVKPFLTAILEDPYILGLPGLLRIPLSRLIVARRLGKVVDRYRQIGGGSPLGKWSETFVRALRLRLRSDSLNIRIEHAFRYCPPLISNVLTSFKKDGIGEVVMLPLFPHYTRAMTGSISALAKSISKRLNIRLLEIPVWGGNKELLDLQTEYLHRACALAGKGTRVLFVAHGIPLHDVRRGDDYPRQVEQTAELLGSSLPVGCNWSLAYSSRLGPVKWVTPYLEDELARLGRIPQPLIIMQLSFVFDCLETLYDLDIVATKQAKEAGISNVIRVPSFNDDSRFVDVIASILSEALNARE